jgi:hypothetical protein
MWKTPNPVYIEKYGPYGNAIIGHCTSVPQRTMLQLRAQKSPPFAFYEKEFQSALAVAIDRLVGVVVDAIGDRKRPYPQRATEFFRAAKRARHWNILNRQQECTSV